MRKSPPRSFRWLVVTRTLWTLTSLIVLCGAATAWILHREVSHAGRNQALQRAESAAPVAVFPLLVGLDDSMEAHRAADALVGGDVLSVQLLVGRDHIVAASGKLDPTFATCLQGEWPKGEGDVRLVHTQHGWCVLMPVVTTPTAKAGRSQVGAVKLLVSDAWTKAVIRKSLVTVGLIWLVAFAATVWMAVKQSKRVMRPLVDLAGAMAEGRAIVAPVRGAKEIVVMTEAFNALMKKLEDEARSLENKVEQRTIELRGARDEAQMAERYTTALMAGMSHEMRTPLHVIQGYAGLARGDLEFVEGGHDAKDYLKIVQTEAARLLDRVDELLRYSAAQAGSHVISMEPCDLSSIAGTIQERCQMVATTQGNLFLAKARQVVVMSDKQLLTQIVSNLATNACKFTRQGTVEVSIEHSDNLCYIEVKDDGPGFNRNVGVITHPNMREEVAETKRFTGMGLGLTIVTRFVELLGGEFTLDSEPGEGTRATVKIPAQVVTRKDS